MQNFWVRLIIFLILNFGALGIGSFLMDDGPLGPWYQELARAPWEPPGWVFGAAWSLIMICFSIFMASVTRPNKVNLQRLVILYIAQLFLNIGWNPVFFKWHMTLPALIVITCLLIVVFALFREGKIGEEKPIALLLLPYIIWLCIAISLNAYVVAMN